MKEHRKKIELEVEQTMGSLDRMERLKGNQWLYTRIQQRVSENEEQTIFNLFSLGRLQPLFFAALLLANIWTAYTVFDNSTTEEDYLETLVAEYSTNDDQLTNYYIEE